MVYSAGDAFAPLGAYCASPALFCIPQGKESKINIKYIGLFSGRRIRSIGGLLPSRINDRPFCPKHSIDSISVTSQPAAAWRNQVGNGLLILILLILQVRIQQQQPNFFFLFLSRNKVRNKLGIKSHRDFQSQRDFKTKWRIWRRNLPDPKWRIWRRNLPLEGTRNKNGGLKVRVKTKNKVRVRRNKMADWEKKPFPRRNKK